MSLFDPDTRAKLAAFLASEKDTRPYDDTYQRGLFAPLGVNGYTGKTEAAVPSLLHAPWHGMNKLLEPGRFEEYYLGNDANQREQVGWAADVAGGAMTGSVAAGGKVPQAAQHGAALPPPPKVSAYPLEPGTGRPTMDARLYPEGVYPSEGMGLFDALRRKGMTVEAGKAAPARVPVSDVVPSQPLSDLDPSKVSKMASDGVWSHNSFDTAPQAYEYGGRYYLIDGHHRLAAAQQRGDELFDAYVKGTRPRNEVFSNPRESAAVPMAVQSPQDDQQNFLAAFLKRFGR